MTKPLLGIALKLLSTLVFGAMVVLIKIVGLRVPAGEAVFFRSFFAIFPVFLVVGYAGGLKAAFRTERPLGHVIRSFVGVSAMFLWFGAFQRMPIADALAISYAAPLMTVALAALLLGETVRVYRWTAVVVGFAGVLVILAPHLGDATRLLSDQNALGAAMSFGSAFFMALAAIQVRRLTMTERTGAIVVYFSLGSSLFALLTLPFGWVVPSPTDALLLVCAGLLGGIGQLMLTQAYRHADASIVAPLEYTSMLWAVIAGVWLFDEVPGLTVVLGSAIVIGAGIFVVLRERRLGRVAPTEIDKAAPPGTT